CKSGNAMSPRSRLVWCLAAVIAFAQEDYMLAIWLPQHTLMVSAAHTASAGAMAPFQLVPYPQKVRAFYSLTDATVPAALQSNSVPLPVGSITANARTTDGALWLGTTQGLMRLDLSAPQRDRRKYFAGRRDLSDDL